MLKGKVYKIETLKSFEIDSMYDLMMGYYENLKKEIFISDLYKKDYIILLKDKNGQIKGFSTIVFLDVKQDNKTSKMLFSGDTIIDKDYWSKNDLMQTWIKFALLKREEFREKLYWLLISKGYKTYKYLSTMFLKFYPRCDEKTPDFEQGLMNNFAKTFYYKNYDDKNGIIKADKDKDFLKDEFAKISPSKLKSNDVSFFVKKNPRYFLGDELVCITEISKENLTNAGKRMLGI